MQTVSIDIVPFWFRGAEGMLGPGSFHLDLLSESHSQNTPHEEEQRFPSPTPSSFQELQKLSKLLPQTLGVHIYSHSLSTQNSINLPNKQVALTFLRTFPSNKNNDTQRGKVRLRERRER